MKNMKKLLGIMAAFGLSTLGTVNVVACSSSSTTSNDLDNSFQDSYTTTFAQLPDTGVTANGDNYNFTFGNSATNGLKQSLIDQVITTKDGATITGAANIKKQIGTTIPSFPTPTAAGMLAAGITANDQPNLIVDTSTNTVKVSITLNLWKSIAEGTSFIWQQQTSISKSVDLLVTVPKNLNGLPDSTEVSIGTPLTAANFKAKVLTSLQAIKGYEALQAANISITHQDDSDIADAEVVVGATIIIKVSVVQATPGAFTGSKIMNAKINA